MPPLRGREGVRGRSRDIVSQVEAKLKLNNRLPREILEATRSSLRVLKIRNPIGCFGKYDNETKRACALLEYEVRDYNINSDDSNSTVEVAMERLAKAAFMKLKDFRDFHEKIGNFRDNLRIGATTTSKTKGGIQRNGSQSQLVVDASSKSGIVFRKSSISSLAIQLGAFVPNSSGAAMRAQKLFADAVDILKRSSKKGGIYGLQDVQKNQSAYEAACFYLVATSDRVKNASSHRRRKVLKEFDDGDDIQQLDLITFMDITKAPSQFQMILDYVRELKNDIESKQNKKPNTSEISRRSLLSLDSSIPSRKTKSKTSRKRSKEEAFDVTQAIGDNRKRNNDEISGDRKTKDSEKLDTNNFFRDKHDLEENDYDPRLRKRRSGPNAVFKEWKAKVLREGYEDAKHAMRAGDANGDDSEEKQELFEPKAILGFVVRGILARNGLWGKGGRNQLAFE